MIRDLPVVPVLAEATATSNSRGGRQTISRVAIYHREWRRKNREHIRRYESERRARDRFARQEVKDNIVCGFKEVNDWCIIHEFAIECGLKFFWVTKRGYSRIPRSDEEVITGRPQNFKFGRSKAA